MFSVGMTLMMNLKIRNWKHIICTWNRFKKLLQMLLTILDPSLMLSHCKKVQTDDDNYNLFANDREHPKQPESINVTYLKEHSDTKITTDSLDMSNNGGEHPQDFSCEVMLNCLTKSNHTSLPNLQVLV
ncbi:hypothetical protein Tco_0887152 [Tanacetum coccineum]